MKIKEAYNDIADKYLDLFHNELESKEYDRNILDFFAGHFKPGALLCDAGCGPSGHIGKYLYDNGMRVVGVDISDRCIEIAKKTNPGLEYICNDIAGTSFPDSHFDGIVSYYSIIHTPKKLVPVIFKEFYRILRPGGYLLVTVKEGSEEGLINELIGIKTEIYFSLFSEAEIKDYFVKSGFELVFSESRDPYDFEIQNKRIYAIGNKKI